MATRAVGNLFNLVREINLGAMKEEAEKSFSILVTGEPVLARRVAEALSHAPGQQGVHPWLEVRAPAPVPEPREVAAYDLALVVMEQVEPSEGEATLFKRLHEAKVPAIAVVMSEQGSQYVGAELGAAL